MVDLGFVIGRMGYLRSFKIAQLLYFKYNHALFHDQNSDDMLSYS